MNVHRLNISGVKVPQKPLTNRKSSAKIRFALAQSFMGEDDWDISRNNYQNWIDSTLSSGKSVEEAALEQVEAGEQEFFNSGREWPDFVFDFSMKVGASPEAAEADSILMDLVEENGMYPESPYDSDLVLDDFADLVVSFLKSKIS